MHLSVLVADDEDDNRELIAEFLTRNGYDVYQARDGDEALRLARQPRIRMGLFDFQMPRKTGLEVLETLRRERNDLPVVLMTARPLEEIRDAATQWSSQGLLRKPLDFPALRETVIRIAGVETSLTVYRSTTTIRLR